MNYCYKDIYDKIEDHKSTETLQDVEDQKKDHSEQLSKPGKPDEFDETGEM